MKKVHFSDSNTSHFKTSRKRRNGCISLKAKEAIALHNISISLVCRTVSISETCYQYDSKLSRDNKKIADLLLGLTQSQRNWGFGLYFLY